LIVALVAAVAQDGVIGREGELPWHLPEDLAHFRAVTMGHSVVMGRRTWESLPERFRPLPGRRNVVVTRNASWRSEGAERAGSLEDALALLTGEERVSVIGGGELFAAALPVADELVLTEIDVAIDGDTFFPGLDRDGFVEVARDEHIAADGTPFAFVTYRSAAAIQLASEASKDSADFDVLSGLEGGR
jgi:dihydrofolate reductase